MHIHPRGERSYTPRGCDLRKVMMNFQNDAPIIKRIFDFYLSFHKYAKSFPKTERIIFARIENTILDLLELVTNASYLNPQSKLTLLKDASKKLDLLKILVRLILETKIIKDKEYLELQSILQEIGKMLGGWLKKMATS